jgi:hypothetical protein
MKGKLFFCFRKKEWRAKYGKGNGIWRKRNGNDKIINGNGK